MNDRTLRAALISTDAGLRAQMREMLADPDLGVSLGLEIPEPFAAYGEEQVLALRQLDPELVVIDLENDPELGVRFTQFLHGAHPGQRHLAVGPPLSSELLLAAMRAGVVDYLTKPVTAEALRDAVLRIGVPLGHAPAKVRHAGRVLTFFSPKGGSGVTSVAANLAIVIHRLTGKRTLLVDLDLELGEVALLLGVQPRFNFVDLVQNFHRMDAGLLASYIEQHSSGVHLLSAPFHPERAETVSGDEIRRILHFLRQHYDYIVVDTPKSFSPGTLAAFDQSETVFLVANVDLPSLRNIQRGLPMLRRVLLRGDEQIRLIINRYNPSSDISLEDVERALALKMFGTIGNDYEAVVGAINSGKPIVLNGTSVYARDLKAIGVRIVGVPAEPSTNGRRSWLSKVWKRLRREREESEL